MTPHRRDLLAGLAALAAAPATAQAQPGGVNAELRALEASVSGRLGVYAARSDGRMILAYNMGDRFPMCSTFKASLVGAVLARIDRGREQLTRRLPISPADILPNSATVEAHLAAGAISVADTCAAAIHLSDNAAANLLLRAIGGPAALTRFWRGLGDPMTRLDRTETSLNEAAPGDPRDTTTPAAMAHTMSALLFGRALTTASRRQLTEWMAGTRTGLARLRAGVPQTWRAADKTGTGAHGSTNDIAAFWPPTGLPIIVTCYLTETNADQPAREAVHAGVARLVAART